MTASNKGFGTASPTVLHHVNGNAKVEGDEEVVGNFAAGAIDSSPIGQTTPVAGKFINMDVTGILKHSGTPQTLTGAGAVNITTSITHLVTAGAGDALTLANGAEGQEKFIVTKTITAGGHTSVLTPTTPAGFATLTFDNVGDSAHLVFTNAGWHFVGGTATLG